MWTSTFSLEKHLTNADFNPQPGGLQHNALTAALTERLICMIKCLCIKVSVCV